MSTGPEGDEQASPNTEGTSAPPEATAPPEPPAAPAAPPEPTVTRWELEQRKSALASVVASEVRQGWNVQSQSDY